LSDVKVLRNATFLLFWYWSNKSFTQLQFLSNNQVLKSIMIMQNLDTVLNCWSNISQCCYCWKKEITCKLLMVCLLLVHYILANSTQYCKEMFIMSWNAFLFLFCLLGFVSYLTYRSNIPSQSKENRKNDQKIIVNNNDENCWLSFKNSSIISRHFH